MSYVLEAELEKYSFQRSNWREVYFAGFGVGFDRVTTQYTVYYISYTQNPFIFSLLTADTAQYSFGRTC